MNKVLGSVAIVLGILVLLLLVVMLQDPAMAPHPGLRILRAALITFMVNGTIVSVAGGLLILTGKIVPYWGLSSQAKARRTMWTNVFLLPSYLVGSWGFFIEGTPKLKVFWGFLLVVMIGLSVKAYRSIGGFKD